MTYEPIDYWTKRTDLKDHAPLPWVADYITKHTIPNKILDYGVGEGGKLNLFKGMHVVGLDIVETYRQKALERAADMHFTHIIGDIEDLQDEQFDTVLCSKILLHVPYDDIKRIAGVLNKISRRVIVWDKDSSDKADHVFNHDYSLYFDMKDVIRRERQILFHT